jgi:hypothetical protein
VISTVQAIRHPVRTFKAVGEGLGTLAGRAVYDTDALTSEIGTGLATIANDPGSLGEAVGGTVTGVLGGAYAANLARVGSVQAGRLVEAATTRLRAAESGIARQTTILGENMRDRVIPFAQATNARTLPWGTTPQQWAQMTPQQRWKLNDGILRARINDGDSFRYIGIDPGRPMAERLRFDLTRSELLRLNERGIPYQTVTPQEVISTIGRP